MGRKRLRSTTTTSSRNVVSEDIPPLRSKFSRNDDCERAEDIPPLKKQRNDTAQEQQNEEEQNEIVAETAAAAAADYYVNAEKQSRMRQRAAAKKKKRKQQQQRYEEEEENGPPPEVPLYKTAKNYPKKTLPDGRPNPRYADVLEKDKPIAGQEWVCVSFLSPERILRKKEIFFFDEFVKCWDMSTSMSKFQDFLGFVSHKYNISIDRLIEDYTSFVESERELLMSTSVEDDYRTFLDKNEESLQKRFDIANSFRTSVRGVKFRGAFSTEEEATMRANLLRESDPNFDVCVGPGGTWLVWDPDAYKTGDVQFLEEQLNELHHEKLKNEREAKAAFEQRVREAKQKAHEDNLKKADQYGLKLGQTLDEHGNLIMIPPSAKPTAMSMTNVPIPEIRSQLLDGDDVVMNPQETDHGLSALSVPL